MLHWGRDYLPCVSTEGVVALRGERELGVRVPFFLAGSRMQEKENAK